MSQLKLIYLYLVTANLVMVVMDTEPITGMLDTGNNGAGCITAPGFQG